MAQRPRPPPSPTALFSLNLICFFLPTGKYKYKRMVLEIRNKVTIWITSARGRPKKRKSTLMRILFPSYRTIYLGQEMVFLRNLIIPRYVSLGAKS